MKKQIPNIITLMNLLSGVSGIVAALNGYWNVAFWLIIIGATFDFFDGMVARLLGVSGPLGKELDSLADVVTFGVLPAIIMYKLLLGSDLPYPYFMVYNVRIIPLIAFVIAAMSAFRLAKFNIDTRQTSSFIGLPTPANALFIGSLSYASNKICHCAPMHDIIASPYFLIPLILLLSYLLIAEIPLFALKFKNYSWVDNKIRYVFLLTSAVLLVIFYQWMYMAILIIIPFYILLSVSINIYLKKHS
jgi:CDP-diacylglycerol--serine O-phosphatidyltransferase